MQPSPTTDPVTILCIACGVTNGKNLRQWLGDKSRYCLIFEEMPNCFELTVSSPPAVVLLGSTVGLDRLPALTAQWPTAQAIVLLEPEQESDAGLWLNQGVDDYLISAQFSEPRLLYTVQRLIAQARAVERQVAACTAKLRAAKESAEATNRFNSRLITELGHGLRTQLNAILGYSALLSREPNFSAQHQEDINIIYSSGEQMLALINGLLGMAQLAAAPSSQGSRRVVALAPGQLPCRVLIVEEDWISRVLLQALLAPLGFELQVATNGQEAIGIWANWQPHLIWMNISMADMNGYETTRCLRHIEQTQLRPETPADLFVPTKIIALTDSAGSESLKALTAGCNDVVAKPLSPDLVLQKIAEHLAVEYDYVPDHA
jgi:CheY-like chemotaxis protein